MFKKLNKLLNNSYSPYSNFRVSAIVVTSDLKEFYGVNVENASFGATICAERNAILNAVTNGYKKGDFKEIHILCDSESFGMPCMICRQVFSEFLLDTVIYVYNNLGEVKTFTMKDICPYPFDEGDLK